MIQTNNNPFYQLKLDPEEQAIEDALERDELKSVKNVEQVKKQLKKVASNSLGKTKTINLRLPERVIFELKTLAAEEGLPYQTLASSVLYKFTSKKKVSLN